jgi:hypothetical protein
MAVLGWSARTVTPTCYGSGMTMALKKFRVTGFRSVEDSGWVETDGVTGLIGTNESGKTNLLLPLWKLNPAKDGVIDLTADYPRKHFVDYRHRKPQPVFIVAEFDVGDELAAQIAAEAQVGPEAVRQVVVSRRFDGEYLIDFPQAPRERSLAVERVVAPLEEGARAIEADKPMKSEQALRETILGALSEAKALIPANGTATEAGIARVIERLEAVDVSKATKNGVLPRFERVCSEVAALRKEVEGLPPSEIEAVRKLVLEQMPKFVYYSNYGNLDSEIYLPHVIQNMTREGLGAKEQAKARTLKVLFEFVGLSAEEILELGREAATKDQRNAPRTPTNEELSEVAEKKKQRSILLQSASTKLTTKFREWWRQGDYRFRFQADGDHFRIWVSDDKRPEEIELEGRSTGLQWFLSFYLVFLVESADAHDGAILLLDEPGLSLHPLAQRNLSLFFDGLAQKNQILYTTHSPFMVDADHLDRVRKVYVASDGTTKASEDLRANDSEPGQRGAGYAVHAALGLSVAESLLLGCTPVIVEGPSDQHYLTAIKNILVGAGHIAPGRELVFPPAGGAKGVKAVASIVGSRADEFPVVLLDGDKAGHEMGEVLKRTFYVGEASSRVISIGAFASVANAEVEDLIPAELLAGEIDRWQKSAEDPFAGAYRPGEPIVPQIERWAEAQGIALDVGWKVELAKRAKAMLLRRGHTGLPEAALQTWNRLFDALKSASAPASDRPLAVA